MYLKTICRALVWFHVLCVAALLCAADPEVLSDGSISETFQEEQWPEAPDGEPYVAGYVVEDFRRKGGLDHPDPGNSLPQMVNSYAGCLRTDL